MNNLKLLPHSWQSAGWGFIGGGAVLLLYSLFVETDSSVFFASTQWAFGKALFTVGFLILAFSRELFEDERINSIRFRTLGVIAIIYAVMIVAYPIIDWVLVFFFSLSPFKIGEFVAVRGLLGILPLYVVLFKFAVWAENRSLHYEE